MLRLASTERLPLPSGILHSGSVLPLVPERLTGKPHRCLEGQRTEGREREERVGSQRRWKLMRCKVKPKALSVGVGTNETSVGTNGVVPMKQSSSM